MILISNFSLNVTDRLADNKTVCTAVPATEIYGAGTYINIGSGNVFRLFWDTPVLPDEAVDRYSLIIKRHDTVLNAYYDILSKNIGLVNEFYVDSAILPTIPLQYMLSIYIVAYGKQGSVIVSNVVNPYISKGTGTYVKVQPEGYQQQIMKRALAFVETPVTDTTIPAVILDEEGNIVPLLDSDGNEIPLTATNILTSSDWNVAQEYYTKIADGTWQISDIRYEVLVDKDGYIIYDSNNKSIYTL